MRKALWSSAAIFMLLSSVIVTRGVAQAADSGVKAGSQSEPLKFLPAEITVPVGATVEWVNETDIPHDVVADDGSFNSDGTFGRGEKFQFKFTKPGTFTYYCTPHKDAGMKGVVNVTGAAGGAPTPTTVAPTTTTTKAAAAPTPATAPAAQPTTTTTAKAAAGGSTTTTTAGAGVTSTTQAPAVTPTSAPESAGVTTTTAGPTPEAGAVDEHASEKPEEKEPGKSSPLGIAFAGISTVLLAAISGKLLASKS
ncbi:MAG: plastocyanin/azurin family copper-binding protein [Actinomycetota bacterium]|jgi:plastocyanin